MCELYQQWIILSSETWPSYFCSIRELWFSLWWTLIGYVSHVYMYVYMCMYVRRCGSLYLVGIRPLALVLITLSCLLRPCNLPPLKCGFKKKKRKRRINPLALIVSSLSFIQPTVKVSVHFAPPRLWPPHGLLPPIPAGQPPFSQLRC